MDFGRIVRHLCTPHRAVRRAFPAKALQAIEEATRQSETLHRGQIRFAVEASMEWRPLWRGQTPRSRGREVFSMLGVWDTAENNGVLIYLLLADRHVEIVADRGVHERAGSPAWEAICRRMEAAFRRGQFEAGVIDGIQAVTGILAREYPASSTMTDELPNQPAIIQ